MNETDQILGECDPGGPAISRLADEGEHGAVELPRPMLHSKNLDMSFSGLKTAVLTAVNNAANPKYETFRRSLARDIVDAVAEVLTAKAIKAIKENGVKSLVAGNVYANKQLRESLKRACKKHDVKLHLPPINLCTDNGAMLAIAGPERYKAMTEEEKLAPKDHGGFSVKPRRTLEQTALT